MKQDSTAAYWQQRYETEQTGWDTGGITPPLKEYFDQIPNKNVRILIPGCGNAYEAEYVHQQDFSNVYIADVAKAPLQNFARRVPDFPAEHLLLTDFFTLEGKYDYIIEQTFFCAIDPILRANYAAKCASLLKPGGKLTGLLFDTTFEKQGPPFGGSREEYKEYFKPFFHFRYFETAYNSIPPRQGRELFMVLELKE